jgi:hypothetical protein
MSANGSAFWSFVLFIFGNIALLFGTKDWTKFMIPPNPQLRLDTQLYQIGICLPPDRELKLESRNDRGVETIGSWRLKHHTHILPLNHNFFSSNVHEVGHSG